MKRVLLFLLFIPLLVQAQSVDFDKQETNGNRTILTSTIKFAKAKGFFGTGAEYEVKMSYCKIINKDNSITQAYYITIPITCLERQSLSEGRKLLIKFENGQTIELKNASDVTEADNTYEIIGNFTFYYINPLYLASINQLDSIIKNKVIKLRIETGAGYFDLDQKNYTKLWNFSGAIANCYNIITHRLSINNDIHNGF